MASGEAAINAGAHSNQAVYPLIGGFSKDIFRHKYHWKTLTPAGCSERLSQKSLDVALLPAIDYSAIRSHHPLVIVPGIAVSSHKKSLTAILLFNRGLSDIRSVAVDERSPAETALLKIILKEKFRTEPALIPMPPDHTAMLQNADAALITGDEALPLNETFEQKLDLGEEWDDLTDGLPFVSAFWAGHKDKMDRGIVEDFILAKTKGLSNISGESTLALCTGYDFGEPEKNGLMEFYSYSYYYGLINEIPELHFLPE